MKGEIKSECMIGIFLLTDSSRCDSTTIARVDRNLVQFERFEIVQGTLAQIHHFKIISINDVSDVITKQFCILTGIYCYMFKILNCQSLTFLRKM